MTTRTLTLSSPAGIYHRNRLPDATHVLAHELGVSLGTACGRVFTTTRTAGLVIDAEPRPVTCRECREATR